MRHPITFSKRALRLVGDHCLKCQPASALRLGRQLFQILLRIFWIGPGDRERVSGTSSREVELAHAPKIVAGFLRYLLKAVAGLVVDLFKGQGVPMGLQSGCVEVPAFDQSSQALALAAIALSGNVDRKLQHSEHLPPSDILTVSSAPRDGESRFDMGQETFFLT
ncbi:hypothetical protein BYZ73_20485 [Rhodovulum viride]|uniref:Uncharacterized protein n=1 Tax=Rhodovulum viride TaxID=1231134 RepID=A0ABX9DBG8_9RHOB|nr:hypothetical protein BYZ73_20485 [Rhodovulum viride]